jgi:hypothetical protein
LLGAAALNLPPVYVAVSRGGVCLSPRVPLVAYEPSSWGVVGLTPGLGALLPVAADPPPQAPAPQPTAAAGGGAGGAEQADGANENSGGVADRHRRDRLGRHDGQHHGHHHGHHHAKHHPHNCHTHDRAVTRGTRIKIRGRNLQATGRARVRFVGVDGRVAEVPACMPTVRTLSVRVLRGRGLATYK